MAVVPSIFGVAPQFVDTAGEPAVGDKLFFYVAGSNTKQNTYTDSTGMTANPNPIILDALGMPSNEIWWTDGFLYKMVWAPSTDTDPPTSPIRTFDNLSGINDSAGGGSGSQSEWVIYPSAPTYISATSFSVAGDQTALFNPKRRVRTVNSGGTIYSTIVSAVFGAVTTVTVVNDSGVLDAGLSQVSYGLLSAVNPSMPEIYAKPGANADITSLSVLTSIPNGTVSNLPSVAGLFKNLAASTSGTSANITVTADEIVVENSSNQYATLRTVSLTIAGTSVGANALDAGTIAASTWYSVWVIWNGTTTAGLLSTSATAPTLPSGYTHKARVGWIRTDATGNKYPLKFNQYGRRVRYTPASGTNLTVLPQMAVGTAGSMVTPTWVAIGVSNYVPSTAQIIALVPDSGANGIIAAPSNNYGAYNSATNNPPISLNTGLYLGIPCDFLLESTNIYWASGGSQGAIYAYGWEDSI